MESKSHGKFENYLNFECTLQPTYTLPWHVTKLRRIRVTPRLKNKNEHLKENGAETAANYREGRLNPVKLLKDK